VYISIKYENEHFYMFAESKRKCSHFSESMVITMARASRKI